MNNNNIQVWRLNTAKANFQLGSIGVEPMGNQLRGPSRERTIGPRAMDVLVQLAADGAQVVSREELNEKVWGGRSVVDEALSRCISELRHAIEECGGKPTLIKTVRGRGYQLSVQPVYRSAGEVPLQAGGPADAENKAGFVTRVELSGKVGVETVDARRGANGKSPIINNIVGTP